MLQRALVIYVDCSCPALETCILRTELSAIPAIITNITYFNERFPVQYVFDNEPHTNLRACDPRIVSLSIHCDLKSKPKSQYPLPKAMATADITLSQRDYERTHSNTETSWIPTRYIHTNWDRNMHVTHDYCVPFGALYVSRWSLAKCKK